MTTKKKRASLLQRGERESTTFAAIGTEEKLKLWEKWNQHQEKTKRESEWEWKSSSLFPLSISLSLSDKFFKPFLLQVERLSLSLSLSLSPSLCGIYWKKQADNKREKEIKWEKEKRAKREKIEIKDSPFLRGKKSSLFLSVKKITFSFSNNTRLKGR